MPVYEPCPPRPEHVYFISQKQGSTWVSIGRFMTRDKELEFYCPLPAPAMGSILECLLMLYGHRQEKFGLIFEQTAFAFIREDEPCNVPAEDLPPLEPLKRKSQREWLRS